MNINNFMKSVELEKALMDIAKDVDDILAKVQAYSTCMEVLYKNKEKNEDFIADMQMKQATLLKLVNRLNDISMQAMAINEQSIVFKCDGIKLEVRNTMERVRNLYM